MLPQTLAALAVSFSAQSEFNPPQPENPAEYARWSIPPRATAADFPRAALRQGISGHAAIRCAVTPNGVPEACTIVAESPNQAGFGAAALRVVRRGRLDRATIVDSDLGRTFQVIVPFTAPPR
ncbi:MAG: TonB family protein [Brevundimonas sp.]